MFTSLASSTANDEELRMILRAFRYHFAQQDARKVTRVYSNATLEYLTIHKPKTLLELLRVPGITLNKAEEFGEDLLEVIHRHMTGQLPLIDLTHIPRTASFSSPLLETVLDETSENVKRALREFRYSESKANGQPAYIIFTNQTLIDIAIHKPTTLEELGTIYGIGPRKIQDYGEAILAIVQKAAVESEVEPAKA